MGSGASVSMAAQQQVLDEKVAALLTLKWDRVHLRCHYATTEGNREIDPQISFLVIAGDGEDQDFPIVPSILEDKNSPATCTWLLEDRTHHPIWNESQLLLYMRSNADSALEVTRRLKVRLEDYRTLRDRIGDTVGSIKHGVGAGLRKVSNAMGNKDDQNKHYSPTLDNMEGKESRDPMSEEAIRGAAPAPEEPATPDNEAVAAEAGAESSGGAAAGPSGSHVGSAATTTSNTPRPAETGGPVRPPEILVDVDIDLPQPDEGWVSKAVKSEHATVYFSVRTSLAEDVICPREATDAIEGAMATHVLEPLSGDNKALLRHYTVANAGSSKALLWIGGFNDTFHNPIAAKAITEAGFDLWTLDLRRCGACRRQFPELQVNPLEYHHTETLDEYIEEIDMSLDIMRKKHTTIVGYGHGTGALAFLNYMRFGAHGYSTKQAALTPPSSLNREAVKGFVFNSPFLDCSVLGHDVADKTKEYFQAKAMAIGLLKNTTAVSKGGSVTALNSWPFRLHSLWPFDPSILALYELNITTGWKQAVKSVIADIEMCDEHEPFTHAPFLMLASRQDKYISERKLQRLCNKIGPMGTLIQIQHAEHDVLCSFDMEKTKECVSYLTTWLKSNFDSA